LARIWRRRHVAATALGAFALAIAVSWRAGRAQDLGPALDLKPGQEATFPVAIADGKVTLGKPRLSKPGTAEPKDGEITVSVVKQGLSPYAELTASEKTPAPVDFVATGLIGDIKVDEVKVCGRLFGPSRTRIASGAWRISLNRFAVERAGQECR
jgi:hypothetical protein